jgi:Fe-Mn family superoxide dismutase
MSFKLMNLPYDAAALEPAMSKRTVELHHGKHHAKYVKKLNELVDGTSMARLSLPEIIEKTADDPRNRKIFNNAGQVWNHDFFWKSMRPEGGAQPGDELRRAIERDFGSTREFDERFIAKGEQHFGSGWVWLAAEGGKLKIIDTHDGEPVIVHGCNALLACDLWEHAYYLDYQNERKSFIQAFLRDLANWDFAAERFALGGEGNPTAARQYQTKQAEFAQSGRVKPAAESAGRALDSAEGKELEEARRATKRGRAR